MRAWCTAEQSRPQKQYDYIWQTPKQFPINAHTRKYTKRCEYWAVYRRFSVIRINLICALNYVQQLTKYELKIRLELPISTYLEKDGCLNLVNRNLRLFVPHTFNRLNLNDIDLSIIN